MGKKSEKLRRVVKKLSDRYGVDDESVLRLQSELSVLELLEAAPPERRKYKTQELKFQSPAKQLFLASSANTKH
jgi:hypothetical protein